MEWIALASPAFLASVVEFVEAYTIVLAVGVSRGWRAPLWGVVAAIATLTLAVAVFGATLVDRIDEQLFELVVGTLLLLFGLRWLRKAILRAAGLLPLHDEDAIYREQVAALAARGHHARFDVIGFVASYKAMLLEGLEVIFIVLTLGASSSRALTAASAGALVAFAGVGLAGAVVRAPLSRVPENTLKALVGVVLTAFGVYWSAAGLGAAWPGEGWALVGLIIAFAALAWGSARSLHRRGTGVTVS
ncbi:MAG: hypothetical protein ACRDZO_28890 [Egibacteraceae bacterium]